MTTALLTSRPDRLVSLACAGDRGRRENPGSTIAPLRLFKNARYTLYGLTESAAGTFMEADARSKVGSTGRPRHVERNPADAQLPSARETRNLPARPK